MLWLSHEEVARCGPTPADCIELCARALSDKARGEAELPPKLGVSVPGRGVLHAMPARVGDAVGMKWVSIYPERRPPIGGIVVLNDAATGEVAAVLDAAWITAARTGACAALAARQLAREGAEVVGIVGPGLQARSAVAAIRTALPHVRAVRAFAPNRATAEAFAREADAEAVASLEQALEADVVVAAAPWPSRSSAPIRPEWIRPGAFVCALDYDASVSPECAASFERRFADDVAQMRLARAKGSFAGWPDDFAELHGAARVRPDEKILCANLGIAVLDIAVATAVLERAHSQGTGRLL
jgi:ornithine cyclodeaminase/alanine dehydrogenase-like protein (mu-crystallin family)